MGEHNRALLAEIGVDDDAYEAMLKTGIVCESAAAAAQTGE
jgi:hypothetical protein